MVRLPENLTLPEGFVPAKQPERPVTPRDAASVVLVRERGAHLEVFLQRRAQGMAFAGGVTVFPGGGVDQRDADASVAWAGPPARWWAERFGCTPELARALVCAAVRETFEESGVLFAGSDSTALIAHTGPYADARAALISREISLAQFLADANLVLRVDLLRPWAQWVTPVAEPRRYDTRFFVAAMPEGQCADAITDEAADGYWRSPRQALQDWQLRRCVLLPPTWAILAEIADYRDLEALLAVERELDKIVPKIVRRRGAWHAVLPGDPDYDG